MATRGSINGSFLLVFTISRPTRSECLSEPLQKPSCYLLLSSPARWHLHIYYRQMKETLIQLLCRPGLPNENRGLPVLQKNSKHTRTWTGSQESGPHFVLNIATRTEFATPAFFSFQLQEFLNVKIIPSGFGQENEKGILAPQPLTKCNDDNKAATVAGKMKDSYSFFHLILPKWVQRTMGLGKGIEHKSHEDCLGEVGEKRKLKGDLISLFNHPKGDCSELGVSLFSHVTSDRMRRNRLKLYQVEKFLHRKISFPF